ncbi:MAG: lipoyl synthase [Candidatus Hydrogenedentes bacterium]|nr:lipoyl synthase [Candidatus Hydrogenedentota bacterium]
MPGKFPEWLRRPWAAGETFGLTKDIVEGLRLHTVCQSARCPNIGECWARGTATVMVLGNVCSRNCAFCSVPSGKPTFDDPEEPRRVAEAVRSMELKHAVITTVARDDLPDGGALHIAETIEAVHALNPGTTVEILVSDFQRDPAALRTVLDAEPEVFCHNIETVERLYPSIRDRRFTYRGALDLLSMARDHSPQTIIKSALMAGLGETSGEVERTLRDLVETGCEVVGIGQYLQPTQRQAEVHEFVRPEQFEAYEKLAYDLGFKFAAAGPFVRSSYRSEEVLQTEFAQQRLAARHARVGSERCLGRTKSAV